MEKTNEHPQTGDVSPQPGQHQYAGQQPPPHYGQQPPPYGQPQPMYFQGNPNQMYTPVQYGQPPTVVVVNQLPMTAVQTEWIMPQAKIPAILLIVVAVLNFTAFIGIGVYDTFYVEFIIASVIYMVAGILGLVGAVRKQASQGVLIAALVLAIISLIMSFSQMIIKSKAISLGQLWLRYKPLAKYGRIIIGINVPLLIITLAAVALAITLIVVPSKLLCTCGKSRGQQQAGAVILAQPPQQNVAMNQQQYGQGMYQQQNPGMNGQQNPAYTQSSPAMQHPQTQVSHIS